MAWANTMEAIISWCSIDIVSRDELWLKRFFSAPKTFRHYITKYSFIRCWAVHGRTLERSLYINGVKWIKWGYFKHFCHSWLLHKWMQRFTPKYSTFISELNMVLVRRKFLNYTWILPWICIQFCNLIQKYHSTPCSIPFKRNFSIRSYLRALYFPWNLLASQSLKVAPL